MTDLFAASAMIMMSGGSGNIHPLSVVEPGEYRAEDYGYDGFDPVTVSDYYKRLYELYQELYVQLIGDMPDVEDDEGNIFENVIPSNTDDDFAELLEHVQFGAFGGAVTARGLDGDTEFKFEVIVTKLTYPTGIAYRTMAKMTVKNLRTGKETFSTATAVQSLVGNPPHRVKIKDVNASPTSVTISFDYVNSTTGEAVMNPSLTATARSVDGTKFRGTKSWATNTTLYSEPTEQ